MQKYRPKTMIASLSDRIMRILITCALGIGWFIFLWGVTLPALLAGWALGALLWLCVRQFSKQATRKREIQMRCMIGGELALDRLLLESPRKAAFQCALWLSPEYPLIMHKALDWAVTGMNSDQKTTISLIAQHPAQPVTVQQIIKCVRMARERQMEQIVLCLTAPADETALSYAAGLSPPVRIITRNELIKLAGRVHPATDEELRQIGRQKKTRLSPKQWLAVILDVSHARRYFWYGIGLALLALATGSGYYPFPAAACLGLWAAGRLRDAAINRHTRWTG